MRKMLTIKRANKILQQIKPDAEIAHFNENSMYNVTFKKGGKVYPYEERDLYSLLLRLNVPIEMLEEYQEFYRPTLEQMGVKVAKTKEEKEQEDLEFFGMVM